MTGRSGQGRGEGSDEDAAGTACEPEAPRLAEEKGGWVGIVANRGSGAGRSHALVDSLVAELRRHRLGAEVAWTPEDRAALVERSARVPNCRCLVAVGGDGTVSALINERLASPMTVMPAGTENLVARHFGLRRDPRAVARAITAGRAVSVDVAQADGRRFLLMAGFGFDADVVTRHHRGRVTRSGRIRPTNRMAYVQHVLRASISYPFPTISVRITDPGAEEVLKGTTVFIFNLPRYALGLPFVPVAREDDGWLDLIVFRHPGPFRAFYYLCKVFCGIHLRDPSVYHRRVRRAVVTAQETIPVQLDGDPGGYLLAGSDSRRGDGPVRDGRAEWTVEILPSALSVLVPAAHSSRAARAPLASEGTS